MLACISTQSRDTPRTNRHLNNVICNNSPANRLFASFIDIPRPNLEGLTAEPTLPPIEEPALEPPRTPSKPVAASPPKHQTRSAMVDPEDDPWNSPEVHKGHNHSDLKSNGASAAVQHVSNGFQQAISQENGSTPAHNPISTHTTPAGANNAPVGGWGDFPGANQGVGGFGDAPQNNPIAPFGGDGSGAGVGVGGGGDERRPAPNPPNPISRSLGGRTGSSIEENIVVQLIPEKEGVFMFQHHNYEVYSQRRGNKVVRRYSDFVWLLDCLQKRYPFRILPLLPPKRMAVNGNHLSNDNSFMEKRRRGLARFLNAVARHPILSQEQLVIMFLTVPTVSVCDMGLPSRGSMTDCVSRNWLFGGNKLQSLSRTNSPTRFFRRGSRILYHQHLRSYLQGPAPAYVVPLSCTLMCAASWIVSSKGPRASRLIMGE